MSHGITDPKEYHAYMSKKIRGKRYEDLDQEGRDFMYQQEMLKSFKLRRTAERMEREQNKRDDLNQRRYTNPYYPF